MPVSKGILLIGSFYHVISFIEVRNYTLFTFNDDNVDKKDNHLVYLNTLYNYL